MLEWKGSHTGIAMQPGRRRSGDRDAGELAAWLAADATGSTCACPAIRPRRARCRFTKNGKWLATSGAESIVLWPFFGGGPMGKAPTELAGGDSVLCTTLACHPRMRWWPAGFSDGLVVLADIASQRILPVAAPGRGAISALAWSPDGIHLAFGTEQGFAAAVDFSKR